MSHPPLRTHYFTRGLRRQRLTRGLLWTIGVVAFVWLLVESVHGLTML